MVGAGSLWSANKSKKMFLVSNLGTKAEYLGHSIVIFILLLFFPKASMSPLHAFPSLSIFFTLDSQIRSPRTQLKGVLFFKYSSVSTRHFTFLLRFLSFFLSFFLQLVLTLILSSRLGKLEQADYCHPAYSFYFVFLSMFQQDYSKSFVVWKAEIFPHLVFLNRFTRHYSYTWSRVQDL